MIRVENIEEKFHESYSINTVDGCWIWQKSNNYRYGQISINGKLVYAHRYSWELKNGPIPKGMYVCHHCDVTLCVNPDHLFIGTAKDNVQDAIRKGRMINNAKKMWKTRHHNLDKYYGDFYNLDNDEHGIPRNEY